MPMSRTTVDVAAYAERARSGPCCICECVAGNPAYAHRIVYRDEWLVAFMDRYPTMPGKILVAPIRHLEHVVADLSLPEFLALMGLVYRVAAAVEATVATERLYLLSLGSPQGNRHLHWHIAPLPPGVPYEQPQFQALMMENGVVDGGPQDLKAIANYVEALLSRADPRDVAD